MDGCVWLSPLLMTTESVKKEKENLTLYMKPDKSGIFIF